MTPTTARPSDRKKRTSELTAACKELTELYGGKWLRINNQPRINDKGVPYYPDKSVKGCTDGIAILSHGTTFWIEVKVSPDKLRDSQIAFKGELEKRGHNYIVVLDNTDALQSAIEVYHKTLREHYPTEAKQGEDK